MELAYTASLKLAAERHTGSNPVIPSDHIKSAQCGFKSHQGHAEGICGKQKQVGEPQIPDRSSPYSSVGRAASRVVGSSPTAGT